QVEQNRVVGIVARQAQRLLAGAGQRDLRVQPSGKYVRKEQAHRLLVVDDQYAARCLAVRGAHFTASLRARSTKSFALQSKPGSGLTSSLTFGPFSRGRPTKAAARPQACAVRRSFLCAATIITSEGS